MKLLICGRVATHNLQVWWPKVKGFGPLHAHKMVEHWFLLFWSDFQVHIQHVDIKHENSTSSSSNMTLNTNRNKSKDQSWDKAPPWKTHVRMHNFTLAHQICKLELELKVCAWQLGKGINNQLVKCIISTSLTMCVLIQCAMKTLP